MGYFSDYYLEEFTTDLVKRFLILLNEEKIHENQKYLRKIWLLIKLLNLSTLMG